jgi:hypothetical protein
MPRNNASVFLESRHNCTSIQHIYIYIHCVVRCHCFRMLHSTCNRKASIAGGRAIRAALRAAVPVRAASTAAVEAKTETVVKKDEAVGALDHACGNSRDLPLLPGASTSSLFPIIAPTRRGSRASRRASQHQGCKCLPWCQLYQVDVATIRKVVQQSELANTRHPTAAGTRRSSNS